MRSSDPQRPATLDISSLGHGLRAGAWSVADVTRDALERIRLAQSSLNAFVETEDGRALATALRLDDELKSGIDHGVLHGIPVAVKDNICVQGTAMRAGSNRPRPTSVADAEIVAALRRAGAVLIGRTRMHEIAMGATGLNPNDGGARNPADPSRIPGGSSSGSAVAVAAGLCAAAVGTDTAGSVRIPAALCGVVGFKPTMGALPMAGVLPVSALLDHVGLFGRSATDVALLFDRIRPGPRVRPRPSLRIGVLAAGAEDADPTVSRSFEAALGAIDRAGARLAEVRLRAESELLRTSWTIIFRDAFQVHAADYAADPTSFAPDVRERLRTGSLVSAGEYQDALGARRRIELEVSALFSDCDVLVSPTVPIVPPRVVEVNAEMLPLLSRNTRLQNLAGIPAITIPVPMTDLPVGFQVSGPAHGDALVLETARRLEDLLANA